MCFHTFADTIAFHLQLRLPSILKGLHTRAPADDGGSFKISHIVFRVRVYLMRLHSTSIRPSDSTSSRITVLGEGVLESVIMDDFSNVRTRPVNNFDALALQATVKCTQNISIPSFTSAHLFVKDYIVLSICPESYLRLQHCQLIRLVTDPWSGRR
ncbi:hypothetical protein BJ138DRAFT_1141817 [Hygrophoropsis aurantiaca]|uniref:Uncharacterized protein n=1 Tax=Hygrophoropsis aurantiaca TaxID=72124 RepID=A0ACB8ARB1_9AGAM|nr:hypothetical protein BJ138DRAFT_1141817 [Hygrophoropsis aurantiaca]